MTTSVKVDAHAGWPVKVEAIDTVGGAVPERTLLAEVPPGQVSEFHATDTRKLLVTEVKIG